MVTAGAWRHPGAATRAADQGVPAMACIARPDTPPSMSSFNESSVVREQAGQPTGGRFAEKVKAGSGLALREESPAESVHSDWSRRWEERIAAEAGPEALEAHREVVTYLSTLSPEDREMAEFLLDPDNDEESFVGADYPADMLEHFSTFGGYGGGDAGYEAEQVADMLTKRHNHEVVFDHEYDGDGVRDGWSVSAYLGHDRGSYVTTMHDGKHITDDRDAAGMEAALAYASAIDHEMRRVLRQRDDLLTARRAPTMAEMRAAVEVDTWRAAQKKVKFVREEGADVEEATMRGGRWTEDGRIAPRDLPDGQEHVRLTMSTGVERFVPFTELQRMVLDHRIADVD